jgi:predicted ATPase/DNA-binding SARP family transcriptional activator
VAIEQDRRRLEIRLLGSLEALVGGESVSLGGRQPRTILTLLALSAGTTVSTERLIDGVWGSKPPAGAANTVQVYVSRLRRTLQPEGEQPVLRSGPGGYLLDLPNDAVDVLKFERLARAGHERLAGGDPNAALPLLTEALALWRGPALDDVEQVTSGGLLARLDAHRLAAQVDRVDAEIALGRNSRAVPELEQLIRDHPLDEGLVARLMTVLYLAGRQGDALASYASAVRRLSDELGVDPGPHLRQIHSDVLSHQLKAPETVASTTVSPAVTRTTVDITDDLPSTGAGAGPAHRFEKLRRPRGPLVGRQRELEQVLELLADPGVRVVTLLGPGGMGKTRLAIAVADAVNARPATGGRAASTQRAVLVPLSTVTDDGEMLAAIARAVEIEPAFAGQDVFEAVAQGLADRATVLVLDNLEQLVEQPGAVDELMALLDRLPRLTLVGTSRTALRLQDERLVALSPLTVPDAGDDDPESVLRSDAVRLFVDRAATVVPGFTVTESNALAVGELCRLLDGLPLSLELAAARTRMLSPEEMVQRTDRLLHLLIGGGRDLPERQRSMRAALDWSANLLDPAEASVFAQLSVFTGGWTIAAAEAICDTDDDVFDVLARLVDKSLVVPDGGRLSMLETIREYAAERLASPDHAGPPLDVVRERHINFFVDLAEELGPLCRDSPGAAGRLPLDADAGNLTSALEQAHAVHDDLALGRIVTALLDYWFFSGRIAQRQRWLPIADALDLPSGVRARLLLAGASLAFVQGDVAGSAARFVPAFAAARELGDRRLMGRAMRGISMVARHSGDLDAALVHIDESIDLFEADLVDATAEEAEAMRQVMPMLENERGEVLDGLGRMAEARPFYDRYRRFASTDLDSSHLAWALINVALNECEVGSTEAARDFEDAALRAADDAESAPVRGDVRGGAAVVELSLGDPLRAQILLEDAIRFTHSAGQLLTLPDIVSLLGVALLQTGQAGAAARMLTAGQSWREVRGLAVVGRLAQREIARATVELAALPMTEEIRAERARGAAAQFGRIEALDLPTTVDVRDARPPLRLVGQRDSSVTAVSAADRASLAASD